MISKVPQSGEALAWHQKKISFETSTIGRKATITNSNDKKNAARTPISKMALVKSDQFTIKPEAVAPPVDTSEWPLLLKNYNNCASHSRPELQNIQLILNSTC